MSVCLSVCLVLKSGIEIQSNIMNSNKFHSEILILIMFLILKKKKILEKVCRTKLNFMSIINI